MANAKMGDHTPCSAVWWHFQVLVLHWRLAFLILHRVFTNTGIPFPHTGIIIAMTLHPETDGATQLLVRGITQGLAGIA